MAFRSWLLVLGLVMSYPGAVGARQETRSDALRIYLDCANTFCDLDYYRREVDFVDYVRNRQDADVHVLVATQPTGAGREYTLTFIGAGAYAARTDTLAFATSNTDTEDERRSALARVLRVGLLPYLAGTPLLEQVQVRVGAPDGGGGSRQARPEGDSWNFWVFRIGSNGNLSLEESIRNYRIGGNASASRVTDAWKIQLNTSGSRSESRFEVDDTTTIVNITTNLGAQGLLARSLTGHWTGGITVTANKSTFLNQDLRLRVAPGIEVDLFPYSESSRRKLTLLYDLGFTHFNYQDTTVFDQLAETKLDQSLTVALDLVQPWGTTNLSVRGTNFLEDFAQHEVSIFGSANIRLIRGLSFNMFASVARIKNQRHLAKEGATTEEILLRRRQLETDYRLFTNFGFSYTFGSIFNNVVNPRFRSEGGQFFFF